MTHKKKKIIFIFHFHLLRSIYSSLFSPLPWILDEAWNVLNGDVLKSFGWWKTANFHLLIRIWCNFGLPPQGLASNYEMKKNVYSTQSNELRETRRYSWEWKLRNFCVKQHWTSFEFLSDVKIAKLRKFQRIKFNLEISSHMPCQSKWWVH